MIVRGTRRMAGTNSKLKDAMGVLAETEEVGIGITEELGRNKEKILSSLAKVRDVNDFMDVSRRILHGCVRAVCSPACCACACMWELSVVRRAPALVWLLWVSRGVRARSVRVVWIALV